MVLWFVMTGSVMTGSVVCDDWVCGFVMAGFETKFFPNGIICMLIEISSFVYDCQTLYSEPAIKTYF